jgi:hypothetical protein
MTIRPHIVCWHATTAAGLLVVSSGDLFVNAHEVGLLHELGYEVAGMMPLSGSPYLVDGHEALLRGCVSPGGDFVRNIIEVVDW